ncbi:MAG: hypothetical protein ACLGXA_08915 [Acidobacteriota bacterium]
MGKTLLVEHDFRIGEKIVQALEADRLPIALALWAQFPEYEDWRFVVAARPLDAMSLSDAYLRINSALHKAGITVWQKPIIHVMKTTDAFVKALRKEGKRARGMEGMRLGGQMWGDRWVEEAYAQKIA